MLGFERRISGVGDNRSTNWATTTAQFFIFPSKDRLKLYFKIKTLRGIFLILQLKIVRIIAHVLWLFLSHESRMRTKFWGIFVEGEMP